MDNSNLKLTKKEIIKITTMFVLVPLSFLLLSWDFKWIEGWIIAIWFFLQNIIFTLFLYFRAPQLLKERLKRKGHQNQKKWDKLFLVGFSILGLAWILVMPLEHRFSQNHLFPYYICALGFFFLPFATFLILNTFAENNFASHVVRVQEDRNQQVVSTGVYSIIRHPMYLGAIISYISIPIILNSFWGLLIGLIVSGLFIARIFGEEKTLEDGLEGYKEYELKVKYRLIPHVW